MHPARKNVIIVSPWLPENKPYSPLTIDINNPFCFFPNIQFINIHIYHSPLYKKYFESSVLDTGYAFKPSGSATFPLLSGHWGLHCVNRLSQISVKPVHVCSGCLKDTVHKPSF